MHRFIFCVLASACAVAPAQGNPDLMKTPECLAARQQLDQVLSKGGPRDRWEQVRQQAALKCLGVKAGPLPQGRFVPPPVAVEPIRLRLDSALTMATPAATVTGSPPPLAIPRPPVLTTCDATGCWEANGGRYNRQGPVLLGPRGICTQQGGSLSCP